MADHGTEDSSSETKSYFLFNGVHHVVTGRAAYAKLHVAKHINRSITEIEWRMIIDACMEK